MAEILPIDIDKLTTEPVQDDKITIKVETPPPSPQPSSPPPTDVSDDEEPPKKEIKKELFDKPKILPPVIISKRTGKPKRKMTDNIIAKVFNRICIFTFFFLIIMNDATSVKKHVKFTIAFTAGKAFVNAGASSGRGKSFHPISVTNPITVILTIQIAVFNPFLSFIS